MYCLQSVSLVIFTYLYSVESSIIFYSSLSPRNQYFCDFFLTMWSCYKQLLNNMTSSNLLEPSLRDSLYEKLSFEEDRDSS